MIELVDYPIDTSAVLASVAHRDAGANLLFVGTTREFTDDRQTDKLEYDAYAAMARKEMSRLEAEARARWNVLGCCISHRIGRVDIGEASVAIAVSAAHRDDAFAAGRWLIDELKATVPIWKQEHWSDGTTEWVHPRQDTPKSS